MGKHNFSINAVVGNGVSEEQRVSRRHATLMQSRRKPKIEVVDEMGTAVSFDNYQISTVGAFLHSPYLHCEGEKLQLRLSLPRVERPLLIEGEVVHANMDTESGMGIVFRRMSLRDKRYLQEYVTRRFINNV